MAPAVWELGLLWANPRSTVTPERKLFAVLFSRLGFQCSAYVLQGKLGHLLALFGHQAWIWRLKASGINFSVSLVEGGRCWVGGRTAFRGLIRGVLPCKWLLYFLASWLRGGVKYPRLTLWWNRMVIMSIYINTFNVHDGVWGTSTGPWAEGRLLCCQVSAAALLRHASALVE